jgi:hypothetical protein
MTLSDREDQGHGFESAVFVVIRVEVQNVQCRQICFWACPKEVSTIAWSRPTTSHVISASGMKANVPFSDMQRCHWNLSSHKSKFSCKDREHTMTKLVVQA